MKAEPSSNNSGLPELPYLLMSNLYKFNDFPFHRHVASWPLSSISANQWPHVCVSSLSGAGPSKLRSPAPALQNHTHGEKVRCTFTCLMSTHNFTQHQIVSFGSHWFKCSMKIISPPHPSPPIYSSLSMLRHPMAPRRCGLISQVS